MIVGTVGRPQTSGATGENVRDAVFALERNVMVEEQDHGRRGLIKLMLKMPALRGRLQLLSVTNPDMFSLCAAFEEANSTLERLKKEKTFWNQSTIAEYETLCVEIETEIIEMCR